MRASTSPVRPVQTLVRSENETGQCESPCIRIGRAVARNDMIEFGKPRADAWAEHQALFVRAQVVSQLFGHRASELPDLGIAVDGLHHLLGAKRDQYADNDDSNFTCELTPAMQRFWQMKVHAAGPPSSSERNIRA
jgi:hypothetical protein